MNGVLTYQQQGYIKHDREMYFGQICKVGGEPTNTLNGILGCQSLEFKSETGIFLF